MKKLVTLAALLVASAVSGAPRLTEDGRLAAVYDSILHARFDEARMRLSAACPPAPAETCLALTAAAIWWQIQLDPDSRALDGALQTASADAMAAADRWVKREPQRAEAWFYLAGAHAPLTQWRILRGERLAAARDARRIKDALERAIALDPTLNDAYFGIGLYHYYADVAPAALRVLRFLLLMPGGDRVQGMREMQQARNQGVLLGGEADYQMHFLYLWYERDPRRALELLRSLDARYPTNPLFLQRIAETERDVRHDHAAARQAWQMLLSRSLDGNLPTAAETRARLGLARELIEASEFAPAIEMVTPTIAARAIAPYGALSSAQLIVGRAYAGLGDRARAIAALDDAIVSAPSDDPQTIRSQARALRARLRSAAR